MSIQTNWYVITGGPSSGKTTAIRRFESLGYTVSHDVGRELLDSASVPSEKLRKDPKFHELVLDKMIQKEEKFSPQDMVFFDFGLPDNIAYCIFYRILLSEKLLETCRKRMCRGVFLFKQLPVYEKDSSRTETHEEARELNKLIYEAYTKLGYNVIRIPSASIGKRVELVLRHVKGLEGL